MAIIASADDPDSRGNALLDLAEVQWLGGKVSEGEELTRQAATCFQSKGDLVSAARARSLIARLSLAG